MAEESVKIAVLEQRLTDFTSIVQKLDNAIEKISEVNSNLMRMIAVHEEKIKQCNDTDDLIVRMIDSIKESNTMEHNQVKKMMTEIINVRIVPLEEQVKKIPTMEKKVDDATRIKWFTVGCGAVLVVVTASLSTMVSNWFVPKTNERIIQQVPLEQLSTTQQK